MFASHDWAVPIVSIARGTVEVGRGGAHRWGNFPVSNLRGPGGGYLNITVNAEHQWKALAKAMGRPELGEFNNQWRIQNQDALVSLIEEWLQATFPDVDTAVRELAGKWRVPCAPIKSVNAIIADPYLGPKNTQEVEDSLGRKVLVTKTPHGFSKTPMAIPRGAPRLGQHNREVLTGLLGYSQKDFDELVASGVVHQAKR